MMSDASLAIATTVRYESARESGSQSGVSLLPELLTQKQQRQSRMDGGGDEDGTFRPHLPIADPLTQLHVERAIYRARAEIRQRSMGFIAFSVLPITGCFQAFGWNTNLDEAATSDRGVFKRRLRRLRRRRHREDSVY